MKKNFILFLLLLLTVACNKDGYKIRGYYPSVDDGTKVYLSMMDENFTCFDSAVVEDGCFEFEGRADSVMLCMLFSELPFDGGPFVLENGNIAMRVSNSFKRKGTLLNDELQSYFDAKEDVIKRNTSILNYITENEHISNVERDSLSILLQSADVNFNSKAIAIINRNIDNVVGAFVLTQMADEIITKDLYRLMSLVPVENRDNRFVALMSRVENEVKLIERLEATSVGCDYVNFELPDIKGRQVLLSDIVDNNKATLLFFWAGWSGVSKQDMPILKRINDKFAKKGFSMVALSLDDDIDEWRSAVDSLRVDWVQLCDPSGGSNDVAAAYGVATLPSFILIGADGKIIARDLPAYRVEEQLNTLLN